MIRTLKHPRICLSRRDHSRLTSALGGGGRSAESDERLYDGGGGGGSGLNFWLALSVDEPAKCQAYPKKNFYLIHLIDRFH